MATNDTVVDSFDDLQQFQESVGKAEQASAIVTAFLTIINTCLLLTCLSPRCRAISAALYIYSLIAVNILYGLVLVIGPFTFAFRGLIGCTFMYNASRLLQLLHSSFVAWTNIEVLRTIMRMKEQWKVNKPTRFFVQTGATLAFCITVAFIIGAFTFRESCYARFTSAEVYLHFIITWVPGVAVLVLGILNIVGYVRLRARDLARCNQVVGNPSVSIQPTEWFICVTLINVIFMFFEIMLTPLIVPNDWMIMSYVIMRILMRLLMISCGVPILALATVRQTIVNVFRRKHRGQGVNNEESQNMNTAAIENETL